MAKKIEERKIEERIDIKETEDEKKAVFNALTDSYTAVSKLWRDSYIKLYKPWIESILKLNEKSAEISLGSAGTEGYKEFYTLWLNTYQETYGKLFDIKSATPSRNVFESFVESTDIYLNLFRSLITTLERISHKTCDTSNSIPYIKASFFQESGSFKEYSEEASQLPA